MYDQVNLFEQVAMINITVKTSMSRTSCTLGTRKNNNIYAINSQQDSPGCYADVAGRSNRLCNVSLQRSYNFQVPEMESVIHTKAFKNSASRVCSTLLWYFLI